MPADFRNRAWENLSVPSLFFAISGLCLIATLRTPHTPILFAAVSHLTLVGAKSVEFNHKLLPIFNSLPNSDGNSDSTFAVHVHSTISSPHFQSIDPSFFSNADIEAFHLQTNSISDHHHIRINPRVGGYPVFNADRVFSIHRRSGEFSNIDVGAVLNVSTSWDTLNNGLSQYDALTVTRRTSGVSVLRNGGKISGLKFAVTADTDTGGYQADQVYFAEGWIYNETRPAWRVIDFTEPVLARNVWYVDAQNGHVLASFPTTLHAKGMVYKFDPVIKPTPTVTEFEEVDVVNVLSKSPFNGGVGVYGRDFRSMNTCFAYKCLNSSVFGATAASIGTCTENESICVDITSNMKEGVDFFTSQYLFTISGKHIDFNRNWDADGYINGTVYLVWDRAAVMAPRAKPDANGIYNSNIKSANYTGGEQTDSFVEFQSVYFADLQMQFFKKLFDDPNFCLVGQGSNCTTTDPILNRTVTPLDAPMQLKANPGPTSPYTDLFTQLASGKGKSANDPIMFRESESYGDAFFSNNNRQVPGLYQVNNSGTIEYNYNETRNCVQGACLSTFSAQYDFFAFGQDSTSDWGLNDCIVFHELTHSVVAKLIPELPSFIWSTNGLNSDPGAMNEGWADYFAAANCGLSDFRKSYNGHPLRNLKNSLTCRNTVGEVHSDGQIFAGGLWDVRSQILNINELNSTHQFLFDKLILTAIAQGQPTDLFATQYKRIQKLIGQHPVFNQTSLLSFATDVFNQRVLNCPREIRYDDYLDTTFVLPPATYTSANLSTLPIQLYVAPQAGDWGFKLQWDQRYGSPVLGEVSFGYAQTQLPVLIAIDCEIQFVLNKTFTTESNPVIYNSILQAQTLCGTVLNSTKIATASNPLMVPWIRASHDAVTGRGSLELKFTPGQYSKVYLWFAHQVPASIVMGSVSLIWYGWKRAWLWTMMVMGSAGSLLFFVIITFNIVRTVKAKIALDKNTSETENRKFQCRSRCCYWIIPRISDLNWAKRILILHFVSASVVHGGILAATIIGIGWVRWSQISLSTAFFACTFLWLQDTLLIFGFALRYRSIRKRSAKLLDDPTLNRPVLKEKVVEDNGSICEDAEFAIHEEWLTEQKLSSKRSSFLVPTSVTNQVDNPGELPSISSKHWRKPSTVSILAKPLILEASNGSSSVADNQISEENSVQIPPSTGAKLWKMPSNSSIVQHARESSTGSSSIVNEVSTRDNSLRIPAQTKRRVSKLSILSLKTRQSLSVSAASIKELPKVTKRICGIELGGYPLTYWGVADFMWFAIVFLAFLATNSSTMFGWNADANIGTSAHVVINVLFCLLTFVRAMLVWNGWLRVWEWAGSSLV
ncbi:hypothetical protein HK096_010675 [Nowakowskiella sp. JEL0078]|nr:hypothetical protein HK096_010675 [Nowakowskiella sp. JEL0078]